MTESMMTMSGRWAAVLLCLMAGLFLTPRHGSAQDTVGDLRLVQDDSGIPLEEAPSPPGEKVYHLEQGVDTLYIGFDFTGSSPTDVEIRVMGPLGTIVFQETAQYDAPGPKVVKFDNGGAPLADNEYVVNAYVGENHYLADSLQLTVGEAVIPTSGAQSASLAQTPQPTLVGAIAGASEAQTALPGASRSTLILALAGMAALFGVVVWAGWSAMRRG